MNLKQPIETSHKKRNRKRIFFVGSILVIVLCVYNQPIEFVPFLLGTDQQRLASIRKMETNKNSIFLLRLGLSDKDPRMRALSCSKLGELGKEAVSATPELLYCLRDTDHTVRSQALWALFELDKANKDFPRSLLTAFSDDSYQVVANACAVYGEMDESDLTNQLEEKCVLILIGLLNHDKVAVQKSALHALGHACRSKLESVIASVQELLTNDDSGVQESAADCIICIGVRFPKYEDSMNELLSHENIEVREYALEMIPEFEKYFKEKRELEEFIKNRE